MNRPTRRRLLSFLAVLPLIGVLGCSSAAAGRSSSTTSRRAAVTFPVTVRAADGEITVKRKPTAIVSLSPAATEMLYAIGAGHQVKAVDEYSNYPPGAPMTKLDGLDPNVEAIASYKPDLVVVSEDTTSLNRQLKALGIPVLYQPAPTTLAQDYAEYTQLGKATGNLAAATREVSTIGSEIASIRAGVPEQDRGASYYYEVGVDPYYSVTDSTFVGSLLGSLGLHSIADAAKGAASSGGYPELNAEFIVKANPDYIFLADTICCHQSSSTVARRPGWSEMTAVKRHRVLGLNDNIASRWGPRIVILLRDVADEIKSHPVSGT